MKKVIATLALSSLALLGCSGELKEGVRKDFTWGFSGAPISVYSGDGTRKIGKSGYVLSDYEPQKSGESYSKLGLLWGDESEILSLVMHKDEFYVLPNLIEQAAEKKKRRLEIPYQANLYMLNEISGKMEHSGKGNLRITRTHLSSGVILHCLSVSTFSDAKACWAESESSDIVSKLRAAHVSE